jgi:hypothetical protein
VRESNRPDWPKPPDQETSGEKAGREKEKAGPGQTPEYDEQGHVSPLKEDWRISHGGKRVSSTGLAGGLKRQAYKAVHWDS